MLTTNWIDASQQGVFQVGGIFSYWNPYADFALLYEDTLDINTNQSPQTAHQNSVYSGEPFTSEIQTEDDQDENKTDEHHTSNAT